MNNFCSTLALVAITAQALQLDYEGTSWLVEPLPNAPGNPVGSLAQVGAGIEVVEETEEIALDVAGLEITAESQALLIASQ